MKIFLCHFVWIYSNNIYAKILSDNKNDLIMFDVKDIRTD